MTPRKSKRDRAEIAGHLWKDFTSCRPLSYHSKTSKNKVLSSRLERRRLNRATVKQLMNYNEDDPDD